MRSVVLLLGLLIFLSLRSQSYIPFPECNAVWTDNYLTTQSPGSPAAPYCRNNQYSIEKDTLINGLSYQKLVNYAYEHSYCSNPFVPISFLGSWDTGFLRNDSANKRVWYRPNVSSTDTLLFDFNIQLNSFYPITYLNSSTSLKVDSIKGVTISGRLRRQYYLCDTLFPISSNVVVLTEGIGASSGLLQAMYSSGLGWSLSGSFCHYPCGPNSNACNLITNTEENDKDVSSKRSFYVSDGYLKMKESTYQISEVLLLNSTGQLMKRTTNQNDILNGISIQNLKGVFLIKAFSTQGKIYSQKIWIPSN